MTLLIPLSKVAKLAKLLQLVVRGVRFSNLEVTTSVALVRGMKMGEGGRHGREGVVGPKLGSYRT